MVETSIGWKNAAHARGSYRRIRIALKRFKRGCTSGRLLE